MTANFSLNKTLENMAIYTSKAIANKAAKMPDVMNLSFGEPEFGPPAFLQTLIEREGLSWDVFMHSVKGYEQPKGSLALRQSIAAWYQQRYGLTVDPECEIMVTHGGVEAINLAIQCTTQEHQGVIVSHPSYMLYERAVTALNRKPVALNRPLGDSEYCLALEAQRRDPELQQAGVMIVNSPENPSGYMLNAQDWDAVADFTRQHGIWLIHDEVYDVMAYTETHRPALQHPLLSDNTIIINSFSKKFGLPGLRIGWMIANKRVIDMAAKLHDYFYLGVNKQYEHIAHLILREPRMDVWLSEIMVKLQTRMERAISVLNGSLGYQWTRQPRGAMFLFPEVSGLYARLPERWRDSGRTVGECVAEYLLHEKGVAVVPGHVYGGNSANHIRIVLCTTDDVFDQALHHLSH
ncbi:pyridoxal phosphate-dependent aminotransferase [Dickeya dianthicola]|uniref:pyridoxal phosphate-dependent aminotransferase n=1 Tax=Dickeya dianthicola TaxID=204039 RepID=UPI001D032D54|nr:pyridoxal phosphate-dependent aminotransferase [Dickeya dianthicola]MCI4187329.1 pyridoxal phosphate-dependent aminotransferase [Dickeya dianthicola]